MIRLQYRYQVITYGSDSLRRHPIVTLPRSVDRRDSAYLIREKRKSFDPATQNLDIDLMAAAGRIDQSQDIGTVLHHLR